VDTLIEFIKKGKWGDLVKGIKDGIREGIESKGGWDGVAKNIANFIGKNLGTLEIILAFAFGLPLLKALPAAFSSTVMNAINMKRVPGTAMTLGMWLKGLTIAASILLSIDGIRTIIDHDFKRSTAIDNLLTTLKGMGELALAGAGIGFSFGGPPGALIGAITGVIISLIIAGFKWDPLSEETKKDLAKGLQDNIDREINDAMNNLDPLDLNAQYQLESGMSTSYSAGPNGGVPNAPKKQNVRTVTVYAETDQNSVNIAWQNLKSWWDNLTKKDKVAAFVTEGVKNDSPSWWTLVKQYWGTETSDKKAQSFTVEGIYDRASEWWTSVQQYWSRMISGKNAQRFTTEGVVNQSPDWWSQLTGFWSKYITGKNAQRFTTEGVENKSGEWWNQLLGYWKNYITGKNAKRFTTEGVQDQSHTWWNQVTGFWNTIISYNRANEFSIAGVVNDAYEWWYQTESYWDNATRYSTLDASVSIGNPWSAFCDAWNDMQSYFNSNHLTAYVETQRVGGGDDAIVSEATGGVFKNGHWEAIQKFAAGGMPTGELFIAREAGPELVGTLGGDAAVMNNDQIVASVSAGVARAVASVMGSGSNNPIEFTFNVDSETLYRVVRKGEKKASGRYGTVVALG
jgi:hypothetical protein